MLRVLLADDHKVMREGLRMVIGAQANMEVVGEADDGVAAVELAKRLRPDVVVMDLSMPALNGLKATAALKEFNPAMRVLVLTRHGEPAYVQQLLQAGADGYVLKQSAADELVRGIVHVAAGQTYLDPAVTAKAVPSRPARGESAAANSLSTREEQVLRLVAWGLLSKEVAARLQISIKTVETHKANAMHKMGMNSRIDVVRYALLQGWLQET